MSWKVLYHHSFALKLAASSEAVQHGLKLNAAETAKNVKG